VRLSTPPAEILVTTAYAREIFDAPILFDGMALADVAHVAELIEAGIVPRDIGARLLDALLGLCDEPPADFKPDPARGDLYSNRVEYLRGAGAPVGWLSLGRARREATTIAYRIAVRDRLLGLAAALWACARTVLDVAQAHRATLFPDYTYLQSAQPTTFGHYILTFVEPILRDLDRLHTIYNRTNVSPAGCGSVNGSRLPLDRARLADRLGFDGVIGHTRDAMWQADGPIEILALVVMSLINLDRLAEDLQIFSTAEFGLVELSDRHARTSVIMPQKKNPYSLAYVRGACGEAIGTLTSMAAVAKTPSGQIDNRMFAYGDVPRALDVATGAIRLMADVVAGVTIDVDAAARRTSEQFIGATDLAETLVVWYRSEQPVLDYSTAHDIVGSAVRIAGETGASAFTSEVLDAAAEAVIGRKLRLPSNLLASAIDPAAVVSSRTGIGGAAPHLVQAFIDERADAIDRFAVWRQHTEARLAAAKSRLLELASNLAHSA